jgi:hypothetical protein
VLNMAAPPSSVTDSVYTLQGSVNEESQITIKNNGVTLYDSVAASVYQPFSYSIQLSEGNNQIEVSAVDLAGNVSTTDYLVAYTFWAVQPDYYDLSGNRVNALAPSADVIAQKQITNSTSNAKQVELIVVLYDANHTMVDYSSVIADFEAGETRTLKAGLTLPAQVNGYKLKAFIWDSLGGMKPLSGESLLQ